MAVPDERPHGRPRHVRPADEPGPDFGAGAVGFDRQPPQDLTAEQSVLGGMLLSKDAIADVVEVLRPEDFYRPAHQTIYECILDLYGRGEPADAVTVSAELERRGELTRLGGAPYLHTLIATVPTAANAAYYAEIVAEKAVLRRLVEAGTRIVQLAYQGAHDTTGAADGARVDEVVDRAQAAVYEVTERRTAEDYVPLEELLQPTMDEIDAIATRGGVSLGVPTGFADLDAVTNGLHPGQMIVVAARPGLGKALALDTALPTPTGWTTMGEVGIGDHLIGADGTPTRVVAATEVMVGRPCYEVEFCDGTVIVADARHQWLTETPDATPDATPVSTQLPRRAARRAATDPGPRRNPRASAEVRTTEQIAAMLSRGPADGRNHSVRNARPLHLPCRDLPLPPYALGVWLGAGDSHGGGFTTDEPEVIAFLEGEGCTVAQTAPRTYSIRLPQRSPIAEPASTTCASSYGRHDSPVPGRGAPCGEACPACSPSPQPERADGGARPSGGARRCRSCQEGEETVAAILRALGVLGNKQIPAEYLRASIAQRRALLAGLLDTDATVGATGSVQFRVPTQRLAEDVSELVVSLGYRCTLGRERDKGRNAVSSRLTSELISGSTPGSTSTAFTVMFATADDVFRLERKRIVHKERRRAASTARTGTRSVVDVRLVPSVPVRCVQVDNTDHLYLVSRSMIPTHNSTLGLDFARSCSVRHSLTSAFMSLEMSRTEIVMRLLSAEARIRLTDMRGGRMSDDDWTRMARRMSEISEAPLFIDDSPNLTMMEIRAKARRLRQRHDLRLLVIDYLQLMTSGRRVESRQQEVSEFSRQIKLLAKELEIPVVAISQLNRGPEQRTDKRPMLADLRESGCLTARTRLLRADTGGEVSLGELLESGERGVRLWSLDERMRMVPREMTAVFPSGTKEVFGLRLASGRQVEATANHPFLTVDGWCPLGELRPGDRIAVPRRIPGPVSPTHWPDDHVVVLAHLIGGGSPAGGQPIRYTSTDEANLAAVAVGRTSGRLPAPYPGTDGRRKPFERWLDGLGLLGSGGQEKFVPPAVFGLGDEQVALFLRHLWATDGSVSWDETTEAGRIYYDSTSRRLVDDVSRLLLRFGVLCRCNPISKPGRRDSWRLDVVGSEHQRAFLQFIGVYGEREATGAEVLARLRTIAANTNRDSQPDTNTPTNTAVAARVWGQVHTLLAAREITYGDLAAARGSRFCGTTAWKHSPARSRLARAAQVLLDADLEMLATNDVFWDEIAEITSLGEQPVYDATVAGTHNFIANGIAVHNSIEQDADMVILLHRPDAFERDDPRAGEADLILAKHRNGPTSTITVAHQLHYSRFADLAHT